MGHDLLCWNWKDGNLIKAGIRKNMLFGSFESSMYVNEGLKRQQLSQLETMINDDSLFIIIVNITQASSSLSTWPPPSSSSLCYDERPTDECTAKLASSPECRPQPPQAHTCNITIVMFNIILIFFIIIVVVIITFIFIIIITSNQSRPYLGATCTWVHDKNIVSHLRPPSPLLYQITRTRLIWDWGSQQCLESIVHLLRLTFSQFPGPAQLGWSLFHPQFPPEYSLV